MSDFSEEYKKYWTIAWAFHKKYYGTKARDAETWDKVVKETEQICEQYNDCNFIKALMLDVVNELDRVAQAEYKAEKQRKRQETLAKNRAKKESESPISQ